MAFMNKSLVVLAVVACAVGVIASANTPAEEKFERSKIAIAYTKYTLDNGLTLLVHEDHSVPIVSVMLWYNVGSRNEVRGKAGFAHLFEHLFSDGSEHYPRSFRDAMTDLGATKRNGYTDTDRTLFFEDVPASALERTLYLEADRMGFLEKQISKEVLDRERGVVLNEKLQGESEPYGRVPAQIVEVIYPTSHPYSWTTMGGTEELATASVDDVRQWYRTYYGPNNCVLSLAGDVTAERARELVKRYFGDVPPGPPLRRLKEWLPHLDTNIRAEAQERVPQARIYRIYQAPGWRSNDVPILKIVASIFSGSNSGRLNRRLVFEKQFVTEVWAWTAVSELASQFSLVATVKPGVDPAVVEREIDSILNDFVLKGPTPEELQRAKTRELAAFVRDSEQLDTRAGLLAESMTYAGRPDAYLDRMETQANATSAEVKNVAKRWLEANHYTLIVTPYPKLAAETAAVDRSILPPLRGVPTDLGFPKLQTATLSNGVKIILLERHRAPIVRCALVVDAGYSADPPDQRGLASLTMSLLPKGTPSHDAFAIGDDLDAAGARLNAWNTMDASVVSIEMPSANLAQALDIFSDVVLQPAFPRDMLLVSVGQRLAEIAEDKSDPGRTGMNFVRRLLYGDAHPYAVALSGFGDEQTISKITRDDLVAWHNAWFQPNNSTLAISGDVTMRELIPQLERTFATWKAGAAPKKHVASASPAAAHKVYLIDEPDAQQSVIVGAHVSEPGGQPEDIAIAAVIKGLGGTVSSRLNQNLRVDKHWSYNAWAALLPSRGRRMFLVFAPVQTDKTKESLSEILKELRAIAGEKPITGAEFASVMRTETLSLPGRFATLSSIENAAIDIVSYGYPADYYSKYADRVQALTEADLAAAAKKYIHPDQMLWIIRGDLKKIEPGIRELGLGEVMQVDAAGRNHAQSANTPVR